MTNRMPGQPPKHEFYKTGQWFRTRAKAIKANMAKHNGQTVCEMCRKPILDVRPHVDHIEPLRKRPDLAHDLNNLQILHPYCHNSHKQLMEKNAHKEEVGTDGFTSSWR